MLSPRDSQLPKAPRNPLGWVSRAITCLRPGQAFPHPPSTTTQPLHWSHNGIPSIQNKHVITNLRLIDAICVPCLLGFNWSPPNSNGHRPCKPQGTHNFGPWQNSLSCSLSPLWLQPFSPSHSLPTLRLWVILKWVSSRMKLSVKWSFALNKCLCCISWILKYTFVFVLTPLKLGYSLQSMMRKHYDEVMESISLFRGTCDSGASSLGPKEICDYFSKHR